VHPDYRNGIALFLLWHGLGAHVAQNGIEVLFGVASFAGRDAGEFAVPLGYLHHHHLAPPDLQVRSLAGSGPVLPADQIDRASAMAAMPALIKAYLRIGGFVGDGAFVDLGFNTTDVCLILDTARMGARQRRLYGGAV
jgi:putative hemolysin